ncbi:ribosomal protection-like ABC-F family protein [Clostridium kluyveri]|uniref:Predicted ABC transporter with duplicated ATPase domain n=2 Tax=Clostridium kluyveri TaxID=1534 RepID=A5MZP5_CLOK5|nr:ABC-F type ribosomal protection protein [Clostridium kluyveri]EDK34341.1 Predicted ABC transporter with duplicated ATPase domain [Clostridium kluyveri DSM 555]
MLILEARNLKKYYRDRLILSFKNLKIESGDKIGVVGRNGAGKSTLLNILAGNAKEDEGIIYRHCSIAYIKQFSNEDITADGKILKEFKVDKKIDKDNVSGGEYTKLNIAAALSKEGELLLADEPTSNLDYDGIKLLQKKLSNIETFMLISHDRDFMDSLCNKIIEIENGKLVFYEGNYSSYIKQKFRERKSIQNEYDKYISEKSRLQKAITGRENKSKSMKKAPKRMGNSEARLHKRESNEKRKKVEGTAKTIKTRLKKLEVKEKPDKIPEVKFDFSLTDPPRNKVVISGNKICFSYDSNVILNNTDFKIYNGSKTALVGNNGSGKTTLLNLINNHFNPIYAVPKAVIGYFCQRFENLDYNKTLIENVMEDSIQSESSVRTILARLLFFGDDVYKKVCVLSGGERIKVSFAKLFVSKANVLLLDEPTNYLDMQSTEALENIIKTYEGTVLFVSHDNKFINSVADSLMLLKNGQITEFHGNLKEFEEKQELKNNSSNCNMEKSILQMRLTEIISKMSLPNCDKEMLEEEYKSILNQLRHI